MKVSELLKAAKVVIADPVHFTKGAIARDQYGGCTGVNSENATCWCSVGAYYKVLPPSLVASEIDEQAFGYLTKVVDKLSYNSVANYSDTHSHNKVMKMWDEAIKLAEEAEATTE